MTAALALQWALRLLLWLAPKVLSDAAHVNWLNVANQLIDWHRAKAMLDARMDAVAATLHHDHTKGITRAVAPQPTAAPPKPEKGIVTGAGKAAARGPGTSNRIRVLAEEIIREVDGGNIV